MKISRCISRDATATIVLLRVVFVITGFTVLPLKAAEQWDILVLNLTDESTLASNHPAQSRVGQTLERMLTNAGNLVFSQGSVVDCEAVNCAALTANDLISIVRRVDPKIDLVVFYRVRVTIRQTAVQTRHRVAISGQLVNVRTRRILRRWAGTAREFVDVPMDPRQIPLWQAEHAASHAASVGAVLADLLADSVRSNEYSITLANFQVDEINAFEERLHQVGMELETVPTDQEGDQRQLLHFVSTRQYRIRTTEGDIGIKQRIRHTLNSLGAKHGMEEAADGGSLRYFRLYMPFLDRYIAATIICSLLLFYAASRWRSNVKARRQADLKAHFRAVKKLLAENRVYAAIESIDESLFALRSLSGLEIKADFIHLREQAISQLLPIKGDFEGENDLAGYRFCTADEVLVSRRSSKNSTPGIAIGFKRLSGPGSQTRLFRAGDTITVSDLGSRHGTSVDGRYLSGAEMLTVSGAMKIGLGGNKETRLMGSCQLQLTIASHSRGSLLVQLDKQAMGLLDRSVLGEAWPSIELDLATRWILIGRLLAVGVNDGRLDVGCLKGGDASFYFHFENGLEISPSAVDTEPELRIDGARVRSRLPVRAEARLEYRGLAFSLSSTLTFGLSKKNET